MPRGTKKPAKRVKSDPRFKTLVGTQDQAREAFAALVKKDLGSALGKDGLRRLRVDTMMFSPIGGGVVAQASFKPRHPITIANLTRHAPIVCVQLNTIPLVDPVTRTTLAPGVYAVRLRPVGGDQFALDYLDGKGLPVFSTTAYPKARQTGGSGSLWDSLDGIIEWPTGDTVPDDSFRPPGEPGRICLSIYDWYRCWTWEWPDWDWPFGWP